MPRNVIYKCRLCNEIYAEGSVPDIYHTRDIMDEKLPETGIIFTSTTCHVCNGDTSQYGVADFIGLISFSYLDPPTLPTNPDPETG